MMSNVWVPINIIIPEFIVYYTARQQQRVRLIRQTMTATYWHSMFNIICRTWGIQFGIYFLHCFTSVSYIHPPWRLTSDVVCKYGDEFVFLLMKQQSLFGAERLEQRPRPGAYALYIENWPRQEASLKHLKDFLKICRFGWSVGELGVRRGGAGGQR